MKTLKTFLTLFAMAIAMGCKNKSLDAYRNDGVEQEVIKCTGIDPLCDNCALQLQTKVWYHREIFKSWYDNFDTADTLLANKRIKQGDSILRVIKKIND